MTREEILADIELVNLEIDALTQRKADLWAQHNAVGNQLNNARLRLAVLIARSKGVEVGQKRKTPRGIEEIDLINFYGESVCVGFKNQPGPTELDLVVRDSVVVEVQS